MSKLIDDIVICVSVALGLLIAVYLSWALVVKGANYPPTLISAFLGIAIAALTYRFLGGSAETQFSMGVLKLGGSAALLLGTTWFVGDRLREEINLFSSMNDYRMQIETYDKERELKDNEIADLRKKLLEAPSARGVYTITEIKKMRPDNPFIQSLRRLAEGQEGPFSATLREMPVKVAVVAGSASSPTFAICADTLDRLNEGVDAPNTRVQFSRTLADGTPASIAADRVGRIGMDICSSPSRDFDVQVNCPVATKLFSDRIASCAEGASLRGTAVTIGSLPG